MAAYLDWVDEIAIDLPGCPTAVMERQVKRTVLEFVERTRYLRRTSAPFATTATPGAAAFPSAVIATGERVLQLLGAWYFDKELAILTPDEAAHDHHMVDWQTRTGTPLAIVMDQDPSEYWLVPHPGAVQSAALRFRVAFGYTEAAVTIDDALATPTWRDAIAAGARGRLMAMPDKKWSNPALAAKHLADFESACGSGSVSAARGPAQGSLRPKPRMF